MLNKGISSKKQDTWPYPITSNTGIRVSTNFHCKMEILTFLYKTCTKRVFNGHARINQHCHKIQHLQIILGILCYLKRLSPKFWPNFPKSGNSSLKLEEMCCHGYHYYITSFNKSWTQVLRRFKSRSWLVRDSRWRGYLTMVLTGNKAKRLLLVNRTTKTIHHHLDKHHYQF